MIRLANILLLILSCTFLTQAQPDDDLQGPGPGKGPGRQRILEKMEAMRVAFLTNRLDLTTDESTRFWPLYNEYSRKRRELRIDQFDEKRALKRDQNLSEEDSKRALENQMQLQEQELTLKKNYYEKFKAILPAQKLAKLEPAEMEFNREVIRKLKERRERRMGGGMRDRR
jgi:hypothetical protein